MWNYSINDVCVAVTQYQYNNFSNSCFQNFTPCPDFEERLMLLGELVRVVGLYVLKFCDKQKTLCKFFLALDFSPAVFISSGMLVMSVLCEVGTDDTGLLV